MHGGVTVKPGYRITNTNHIYYRKGFQPSAIRLKDLLSQTDYWGEADVIICQSTSLQQVANIIGSRNGVYFVIGNLGSASGHATLWLGNHKNVINNANYAHRGGNIFFWELK